MAKDKKDIQGDQVDNEPGISENIVSEETQEKAIEESNLKKDKKKGGKSRIRVDFKSISPKRLYSRFKSFRRRTKYILVGALLFVLSLAILLPLGYVYKLDSYIFPSKLSGTVVSVDDEFIDKAKVCVQDKCKVTDENGEYVIEGLKRGKYDVSIFKEGYREYGTSVELTHGDNSLDIELQIQGYMSFSGMIQSADGDLMVKDFTIVLGENTYPVEIDELGNFVLESVAVETEKGYLSTPNYMDISFDIDPSKPSMDLGTMDLEKAFDLVLKPVNWINDQPIEVSIRKKDVEEDLEQSQIEDTITVRDLPFQDEELILEVSSDGYISKEVKIGANTQGTFENGAFGLVKEGKVVYKSNRNNELYMSNYDGSEERQLTDNGGNNTFPYYSQTDNTVIFRSDYEGEKAHSWSSEALYSYYEFDLDTNEVSKISNTAVGAGAYNAKAFKQAHLEYASPVTTIRVGKLDGAEERSYVARMERTSDLAISDDGKYIMYAHHTNVDMSLSGVYLLNIHTTEEDMIFKNEYSKMAVPLIFSPDSKKGLLYVAEGSNMGLYVRDFTQSKLIKVFAGAVESKTAKFSEDSNSVTYVAGGNIYIQKIGSEVKEKLTTTNTVNNFVWFDGLIFYNQNGNIYALDSDSPKIAKLVKQNAEIYDYVYRYYWN